MSPKIYEIRSKIVNGEQPNNSLVFSWKPIVEWHVVSIPEGIYSFEDLEEEFQHRINDIVDDYAGIYILPSMIIIEYPNIVVDIYNSSIRTVLGWPENPPSEHHPQILTYNNSIRGDGTHFFHKNITSMKVLYSSN